MEDQWISIKDQVPENGQKCIVTDIVPWTRGENSGTYKEVHILIFRIDDDEMSWDQEDGDDHYCELDRVSYWMPLPEPK